MMKVMRESLGMGSGMGLAAIGIRGGRLFGRDIGRWMALWAIVVEE